MEQATASRRMSRTRHPTDVAVPVPDSGTEVASAATKAEVERAIGQSLPDPQLRADAQQGNAKTLYSWRGDAIKGGGQFSMREAGCDGACF